MCSLQANKGENSLDYSRADYESLSKRSWTDVLLQIYKVWSILRNICVRLIKQKPPFPPVNPSHI